ncbi:hypothetical protein B0O99DRAFT_683339 [Bisporella sp. PMI_857]|nr:hypothetical protein B0O99DRAFT_683339 [Bisporella sp. PMI_857]
MISFFFILPVSSTPELKITNLQPTNFNTSIRLPLNEAPPSSAEITSSDRLPTSPNFNFYFLIVAIIAILLCGTALFISRLKKKRMMQHQDGGQHALERDVESWRTQLGVGRAGRSRSTIRTAEGLDERGEAPPPYAPGSKPPSVRTQWPESVPLCSRYVAERDSERSNDEPNELAEHQETTVVGVGDDHDLRRPERVVVAPI